MIGLLPWIVKAPTHAPRPSRRRANRPRSSCVKRRGAPGSQRRARTARAPPSGPGNLMPAPVVLAASPLSPGDAWLRVGRAGTVARVMTVVSGPTAIVAPGPWQRAPRPDSVRPAGGAGKRGCRRAGCCGAGARRPATGPRRRVAASGAGVTGGAGDAGGLIDGDRRGGPLKTSAAAGQLAPRRRAGKPGGQPGAAGDCGAGRRAPGPRRRVAAGGAGRWCSGRWRVRGGAASTLLWPHRRDRWVDLHCPTGVTSGGGLHRGESATWVPA
jgi:hypothetical protein